MSRLREIREARDLSQADVAEQLGVTPTTISRYEQQDQRLTLPIMQRLSKVLRCSIGQIAGEVPFDALAEDQRQYETGIDRRRIVACIDALDHYLNENELQLAPGGRGDVVAAIYDWTNDERIAVEDIGDLSRIRSLLRTVVTARR
jgi:transcriptional regulator with XRE-family HTH domain